MNRDITKRGVYVANSAGLVTITAAAAGDLVHLISFGASGNIGLSTVRVMARIRKILWYNNSGAVITLIFGTRDNAGAFVALFPPIACVNGLHDGLTEDQIPDVRFQQDVTAGAAGRTGDIYVVSSAAAAIALFTLRCTIEER